MSAAAVLVLGCMVSLALNWPGQLSYDSVMQLHDGRVGHYNPWHPPVMAWMLGLADSLVPGTGLFILFDSLLLIASLISLLWLCRRVSWVAVPAALLLVALPQFVLYQGIVWKDVLFADAAVAGFVFLSHAGARWQRPRLRWSLMAASFLLLVLATLVRQNGVIALISGGIALIFIARRCGTGWLKSVAWGIGATLVAASLVFAASAALMARTSGGSGASGQIRLLQLYDLIGVAKLDPAVPLTDISRTNPDLEKLIHSDGGRLYTPARNDTLAGSTGLQRAFVATNPAVIGAQWRDVVLGYPWDYLRVRAHVFAWTLFTPDSVQCDAWYTGVNGPPQYLRELGLARRFRAQDRALGNYAARFVSTPVFSHAAFAMLAVGLLIFLLWRGRPVDRALAAMLAAALAFAASFFVISIACDYRYLLFLDISALTGLLYCAATWRQGRNVVEAPRDHAGR